jgi:hypothetical protein
VHSRDADEAVQSDLKDGRAALHRAESAQQAAERRLAAEMGARQAADEACARLRNDLAVAVARGNGASSRWACMLSDTLGVQTRPAVRWKRRPRSSAHSWPQSATGCCCDGSWQRRRPIMHLEYAPRNQRLSGSA